MKIKIYLKDPDTLYDSINEAVDETVDGLPNDESEALKEIKKEKYREIANEWFEYGEYVMLEMDTEEKTCRVIPVKEITLNTQ